MSTAAYTSCHTPMRRLCAISALLLLTLFPDVRRIHSQSAAVQASGRSPFQLNVPVDEVSLTFHAADAHGAPVSDLRLDELSVLDNGKPPSKILAFLPLQHLPVRAGILIDSSQSMEGYLPRNKAIAMEYVRQLLQRQSDQAFVMDFAFVSEVAQAWTSDTNSLIYAIRSSVRPGTIRNTAVFDAVYRACFSQFGHEHTSSGNFILLFSDGVDNASNASLAQVVDMCQRTNTTIYAFQYEPPDRLSSGPKTLQAMAVQSGGRIFPADGSDTEIDDDLRTIDADRRNQYRLIYRPAEFKHDGSFHRIALIGSDRVHSIGVRSGYYAPAR